MCMECIEREDTHMTQLISRIGIAQSYSYRELDSDRCAVTGVATVAGVQPTLLVIPDKAPDGRAVVAIDESAFEGLASLRTVCLPDSITTIGRRAFALCSSLTELRVGRNSRLARIGERAFLNCDSLTHLRLGHLRALSEIGKRAFAYCTNLQSVVLPEGLTTLPDGVFEGCRRLSHIQLPAQLSRIGGSAFASCRALTTVRLPDSLRIIEDAAFAWCDSLAQLILPTSACLVAASAFRECPSLPDLATLLGA